MDFIFLGANANLDKLIELSIPSSANDYNIFTAASAIGEPDRNVRSGVVRVTLADGVVVGSTSSSTPGMQSGSGWGTGWSIEIIVGSGNSARIQGAGGAGGFGDVIELLPTPRIRGGGGGGAGTVVGAGGSALGSDGTATSGGLGGSNAESGTVAIPRTDGVAGGVAIEATDGGPDITLAPESTATLEVWSGGGGGGGSSSNSFAGGAGGDPGQAGVSATVGGAGGAAGVAYSEPGSASIIEGGAGTIDKLGD